MLVVSNIDLPTINVQSVRPSEFLESFIKDFILNVNNDYRYLKMGYYVSLHAEMLGNPVMPPTSDLIDAYRTPLLLLKASKAGIPTMPFLVTDSVKQIMSEFNFPLVVFAVNPFSYEGFKIARNRTALYKAVKSLSINYRFAVCAMPLEGQMFSFKSIFGKCTCNDELSSIAQKVFEVFKIPICKLHVQYVDEKAFLCGLQPVLREEIDYSVARMISERVSLILRDGGTIIG